MCENEYNGAWKSITKARKERRKMLEKKSKKRWVIIGVVAVVIIAILIGVAASGSKKNVVEQSGTVEKITRRTIANSITGNGVVESADKQDVTGGSYGMKVDSVKVEVGDVVAEGDVICTFDTSDIDEQIKDLKQRISDTEADRAEQNANYDERIADANADRAEQIATATNNLNKANADLAEAEAVLAQKRAEYDAYINDADPAHNSTTLEAIQMESVIQSKQNNVDSIRMRVDNYQEQINNLNAQDNSTLEDNKKNYNDQMDSTIDSLEEQLDRYEEQKADAVIKAKMSGTVTAVNVMEDTTFSGGVIATIEGVDFFIVEAQIEEYDIPDIAVGMKVLIKTDATRDKELEGVVSYIAPRATNSGSSSSALSGLMGGMDSSSFSSGSGSATYLVKIELKEQNDRLRLGMNAKTSIITEESVDVWSVPYDAVYTREDGSTYLDQVTGKDEEGNLITQELDVEIGLQGTYYVEVICDAIDENTEILVPDAQGNSSIEELLNMMGADAGI